VLRYRVRHGEWESPVGMESTRACILGGGNYMKKQECEVGVNLFLWSLKTVAQLYEPWWIIEPIIDQSRWS
jgi:hypothetical protein